MNVWGDECPRWWMSGWWMLDNHWVHALYASWYKGWLRKKMGGSLQTYDQMHFVAHMLKQVSWSNLNQTHDQMHFDSQMFLNFFIQKLHQIKCTKAITNPMFHNFTVWRQNYCMENDILESVSETAWFIYMRARDTKESANNSSLLLSCPISMQILTGFFITFRLYGTKGRWKLLYIVDFWKSCNALRQKFLYGGRLDNSLSAGDISTRISRQVRDLERGIWERRIENY